MAHSCLHKHWSCTAALGHAPHSLPEPALHRHSLHAPTTPYQSSSGARAKKPTLEACSSKQGRSEPEQPSTSAAQVSASAYPSEPSRPALLGRAWGQLQTWNAQASNLKRQAQGMGLAGVASMVICNSLYYTVSFLVLWLGVLHTPKGLGLAGAARRFLEVFGLMYVGSQASKLPRAAGMLMLAPLVDRGMKRLQRLLHLRSPQAVFNIILGFCLSAAFGTYGVVILAWA